jgi:hypothetical protein
MAQLADSPREPASIRDQLLRCIAEDHMWSMGPNNYTKAIAQDFETHQLSQTTLGSDLSILPISLLKSHNEKTPGRNQGSRKRSR